jgi:hypothetical protein
MRRRDKFFNIQKCNRLLEARSSKQPIPSKEPYEKPSFETKRKQPIPSKIEEEAIPLKIVNRERFGDEHERGGSLATQKFTFSDGNYIVGHFNQGKFNSSGHDMRRSSPAVRQSPDEYTRLISNYHGVEEAGQAIPEDEMWDRDASHRDTYGDTSYEDNWEKGGGPDMEEAHRGTFEKREFNGSTYYVLVDEDGGEHEEYQILDTPEKKQRLQVQLSQGVRIFGIFIVNINGKDVEVAAYHPKESKGEDFGGM